MPGKQHSLKHPPIETELTVGQVAARAGVAISTLHFYESKGLIHSWRNAGNQRRYPREVLRRVVFNPVERPSLTLSPQTGVWDWSGATAMTLRLQSAMNWALTLDVNFISDGW